MTDRKGMRCNSFFFFFLPDLQLIGTLKTQKSIKMYISEAPVHFLKKILRNNPQHPLSLDPNSSVDSLVPKANQSSPL